MSDIHDRLTASLRMDAHNGTHQERHIFAQQVIECLRALNDARRDLAALSASLSAEKEESLKLLASFDCTWGIGSGRHCQDDKPCMSHRLSAAVGHLQKCLDWADGDISEANQRCFSNAADWLAAHDTGAGK